VKKRTAEFIPAFIHPLPFDLRCLTFDVQCSFKFILLKFMKKPLHIGLIGDTWRCESTTYLKSPENGWEGYEQLK
jgi:hypothetical protein